MTTDFTHRHSWKRWKRGRKYDWFVCRTCYSEVGSIGRPPTDWRGEHFPGMANR